MKFRFPLQRAMDVAEHEKQSVAGECAATEKTLDDWRQKWITTKEKGDRLEKEREQKLFVGISAHELQAYEYTLRKTKREETDYAGRMNELAVKLEEKRERLREKQTNLKKYEILKEKTYARYKHERLRREQQMLDEAARLQYGRVKRWEN